MSYKETRIQRVKKLDITFLIIGGDERLEILYKSLIYKNTSVEHIFYDTTAKKETELEKIKKADVLVFPVPISSDKKSLFAPKIDYSVDLKEIVNLTYENQLIFGGGEAEELFKERKYHNLLSDESMTLKNAMATAEAALSIIIKNTRKSVFGSKILILGYGRIAKILANYLKALNGEVIVAARKKSVRTLAEINGFTVTDFGENLAKHLTADVIINTVPKKIILGNELTKISSESLLLDLASKPGGVDIIAAKSLGINYIHALSLPGIYSPVSSAKYIEDSIFETLNFLKGENL